MKVTSVYPGRLVHFNESFEVFFIVVSSSVLDQCYGRIELYL